MRIMRKLVPKPILLLLVVVPWTQDLHFLKFNFLIYTMEVIIPTNKHGWYIKGTLILAPSSIRHCISSSLSLSNDPLMQDHLLIQYLGLFCPPGYRMAHV